MTVMDLSGLSLSMWNKKSIALLRVAVSITQDFYPETLGKMVIVNAPMIFSGIWPVVKIWLDEKTRRKISICGKNYYSTLLDYVNEDQIPECLGGQNKSSFTDDMGPWNGYVLVDGSKPGDVVGVRQSGDYTLPVFRPQDLLALENPSIGGQGQWGTKGAAIT